MEIPVCKYPQTDYPNYMAGYSNSNSNIAITIALAIVAIATERVYSAKVILVRDGAIERKTESLQI